jgi:pyruvate/2-oxoglutarate dehydrogenase complex dihydrolipoamide dehydrogenase (E3) component
VAVTQVVRRSPEVAAVWLTEEEARRRYRSVRTVEHDLAVVAGSTLHADDYSGSGKLVIDADREVIVGATLLGPDVGELLHAATIAVVGDVPISRLQHAVPAFPTISEVWVGPAGPRRLSAALRRAVADHRGDHAYEEHRAGKQPGVGDGL